MASGDLSPTRGGSGRSSKLTVVRPVSYTRLLYLQFRRNRLAFVGAIVLLTVYLTTLFADFVAPYQETTRFLDQVGAPPQLPRFLDAEGRFHWRPFVYKMKLERDPYTLTRIYVLDKQTKYPFHLFVRAEEYRFLFFRSDLHLFGVEEGTVFLVGTDTQGRDVFSRIIIGGRISTAVGLLGVSISLMLGIVIGMVSGLKGGVVDQLIQRGIEVIVSFPSMPLWLALSAALPTDWSPLRIFFLITVILSFMRWGGLARIVRGMTLALKNEEYVLAARMSGGGDWWIILGHLVPANLSYVIVSATMAIPGMVLGETALSFIGLGIRPPLVSWGTLLQEAQKVAVISEYPWLMSPVLAVIIVVLAYNFVGDGLRDAIDPYSR